VEDTLEGTYLLKLQQLWTTLDSNSSPSIHSM